jgi:hypothetical protein
VAAHDRKRSSYGGTGWVVTVMSRGARTCRPHGQSYFSKTLLWRVRIGFVPAVVGRHYGDGIFCAEKNGTSVRIAEIRAQGMPGDQYLSNTNSLVIESTTHREQSKSWTHQTIAPRNQTYATVYPPDSGNIPNCRSTLKGPACSCSCSSGRSGRPSPEAN